MLTVDDFHFYSMGMTEEITLYCPGGYHPIIVGDILRPSDGGDERGYRIMNKLGWGSYATVWLAQKTDSSADFVAVKVPKADGIPTSELAMLQAAAKFQTNNGHSLHVPTLLDYFTLRGPNGIHSVLVTDIIVPLYSLRPYNRRPLRCKTAARGLTQAVVSLHAAGIVHGDLHISNVGFALPLIADQDQRRVMQDLSPNEVTLTVTVTAAQQTSSLPAYVLAPCELGAYYERIAGKALPQTKIFDFGAAHEVGAPSLNFQCAMEACAPEMAFARVVEKIDNPAVEPPADVWALGTAIYEIVAGSPLFNALGIIALPSRMLSMTGSVPPGWKSWYTNLSNPPEVSPSIADAWWAKRRDCLRAGCVDEASTDALIALLRKVLVLDPALRPTAVVVLQDPWFQYSDAISKRVDVVQNHL